MKVRATYNYHDRELGFEKHIGDELNVTDERGQVLIAAGVAEEIVEPVEKPEARKELRKKKNQKEVPRQESKR